MNPAENISPGSGRSPDPANNRSYSLNIAIPLHLPRRPWFTMVPRGIILYPFYDNRSCGSRKYAASQHTQLLLFIAFSIWQQSLIFFMAAFLDILYGLIPWYSLWPHSLIFFMASFPDILYGLIPWYSLWPHSLIFFMAWFPDILYGNIRYILYGLIPWYSLWQHSLIFFMATFVIFFMASFLDILYDLIPWYSLWPHSLIFFMATFLIFFMASFPDILYGNIPWYSLWPHSLIFFMASFLDILYGNIPYILYGLIPWYSLRPHSLIFFMAAFLDIIDISGIMAEGNDYAGTLINITITYTFEDLLNKNYVWDHLFLLRSWPSLTFSCDVSLVPLHSGPVFGRPLGLQTMHIRPCAQYRGALCTALSGLLTEWRRDGVYTYTMGQDLYNGSPCLHMKRVKQAAYSIQYILAE